MIITKAPFRLSLCGGGTEHNIFSQEYGGRVIGGAINKYCHIAIRPLPQFYGNNFRLVYSVIEKCNHLEEIEHKAIKACLQRFNIGNLELTHFSDLPAYSGLGSSSTFIVALIHALSLLNNKQYGSLSSSNLAKLAISIEQNDLKEKVGQQDQVWATYGGLRDITFHKNGDFDVQPLPLTTEKIKRLEDNILLVHTGIQRIASNIAATYVESNVMKNNLEILNLVQPAYEALLNENYKELGKIIDQSWQIKKGLSPAVSNANIDEIYYTGLDNGAWGGKILGSGGGGVVMFIAPKEMHPNILDKLNGLNQIDFKFEFGGSRIVLYET